MVRYYDVHSHLNHERFRDDLGEVVQVMEEHGVVTNVVGWDLESSRRAVDIAKKYPDQCRAVVGVHPEEIDNFDRGELSELAGSPLVVAIGECGLDFYRGKRDDLLPRQEKVFRGHIEIALEQNLPVMLHVRPSENSMDAYGDTLRILADYPSLRAHFHFFAGDSQVLKKVIESRYTVSFTGVITFAAEYDELLQQVPSGQVMVETDAPWVAPTPYRGRRCEPWMVKEVAGAASERLLVADGDSDMLLSKLVTNGLQVFRWQR